jgi:dihydrofolate reductase
MASVTFDISTSLDGFIAGPDPSMEDPLGKGGEQLHEWALATRAWRESHGREGGEDNADSEILARSIRLAGATVMGRKMFSGGEGPWESDPNADAWWGDEPPFHHPVFVVTHHEREPVVKDGGTTFNFVTDGVESAVEQARAVAGERNVAIGGGASVAQQLLRAGLLDELRLHVAPVLLGGGTRLFEDHVGSQVPRLEKLEVVESPLVTHMTYRVVK